MLPGIRIGREAVVAAASVLTKDVPPYVSVMGVSVRAVREVVPEELIYPKGDE